MNQLVCDYCEDDIWYSAYCWYFPVRALKWASTNGVHFHGWILRLKNDINSDDVIAHYFFALILLKYFNHLKYVDHCDIDLIISVPPSMSYEERSSYSLARVAEMVNKSCLGSKQYHHYIRRAITVSKDSSAKIKRNKYVQKASMVADDLPDNIETVLLIDDVMTSGATLEAAAELISEANPDVQVLTFAFGKTQRTGSTPFPDEPEFPDASETNSIEDLDTFKHDLFSTE